MGSDITLAMVFLLMVSTKSIGKAKLIVIGKAERLSQSVCLHVTCVTAVDGASKKTFPQGARLIFVHMGTTLPSVGHAEQLHKLYLPPADSASKQSREHLFALFPGSNGLNTVKEEGRFKRPYVLCGYISWYLIYNSIRSLEKLIFHFGNIKNGD